MTCQPTSPTSSSAPATFPVTPPATPPHSSRRGTPAYGAVATSLACCVTALVAVLTYTEYVHNPFRSGNRRWVSWADSLWGMYCFRTLLPKPMVATANPRARRHSLVFAASPRNSPGAKLRIIATAVAMKFGAGIVVSLLLHKVPVLFKGWRHFAYFMVAVVALQATNVVYGALERNWHLRLAFTATVAVHKLRKCIYVVETVTPTSWPAFALFATASFIAVEGSSLLRRAERRRIGGVTLVEGSGLAARALHDWRTLLQTFWPTLGCLTCLLASRAAAAPAALHSRRGAWVVAAQAFLMVRAVRSARMWGGGDGGGGGGAAPGRISSGGAPPPMGTRDTPIKWGDPGCKALSAWKKTKQM